MSITSIISLNQLISWFEDFQENHYFLKDFGFGEPYDIGTSRQMNFPYMWVTMNEDSNIQTASNNKSAIPDISFSIMFMDKINNQPNYLDTNGFQSDNSQEILSDTLQCVQDLIVYIQQNWQQYGVLISQDVSFYPAVDETTDKATGVVARFVVRTRQVNCVIPENPATIVIQPTQATFSTLLTCESLDTCSTFQTYAYTGGTFISGSSEVTLTSLNGNTLTITGFTGGAAGSSGTSGTSGAAGSNGSSGTSGANGTNGSSGTSGAAGANGSSGTSGANGTNGSSGTSGAQGISGATGSSGTSGTSGVGTNGSSGTSGANGTNGSSGTSGVNGTDGSSGTSGAQGISGATGSSGTSGTSGINGTDGSSGTSGAQGISGATGSSGTSGTSGVGTNGTSGTSGQNGLSNSFFNYQAKTNIQSGDPGSGHILWDNVTQASATSLNVSELEQGNINIDLFLSNLVVGSVITIQDEASHLNFQTWTITSKTDNSTYWTYGVTLNTSTHSFSNNDPILFIVVTTPSGTSGTSGTSGINGTDGSSGTSGVNGTDGSSGTSGADGTSGTSGVDGSSGTSGADGTSGTSGINGTDGSSGTSGADGTSGTSGVDGTSGTSGIDGTSGTSGVDGSSGTSGADGTSGTSGIDGTSGTSGVNGTDGSSGTSGVNGTSGTSGLSGVNGTDGTSGTSGTSGAQGISGATGTSGTSGTSGVSGATGTSGTSGTSGANGANGTSGTSGVSGATGSSGTSGTSGVNGLSTITIGTTGIVSGTVGRVTFEGTGNVVQQDSQLFWDNTNKGLGVGATPAATVKLDVRADTALSTDLAFRVRNSTDTLNLIEARNNGDVYVGVGAGRINTSTNSTFIGFNAGYSNTTGFKNMYIGYSAGYNNTGQNNLFFGADAGYNNTTGGNNVFIGTDAGRYITGGGTSNTISNDSIFLGSNSKANASNETNQIVIGYDVTGLGANTAVLGSSSITKTLLRGDVVLINPARKFGYDTGAGGTVTQITSKATGVTLNRPTGQITMQGAILNSETTVSFTLTNSVIAAGDILVLQHQATGTLGAYTINGRTAAGSATIAVRNITGGSLAEAIVISFAVIKAVTA